MLSEIKNLIEKELADYLYNLDRIYQLSRVSPVLLAAIKDFAGRKGKRIRPILFIIGYRGFAKRIPSGLYRSALALELLHDFMLVHDDIIDKADLRRGRSSMHAMLNKYLANYQNIKFNGQDLAIVVGDVMYALALHAFLGVRENSLRKEIALGKLIESALYTGAGEFSELLYGIEDITKISREEIYKIYDFKTANYTFASPLIIGAILAGAAGGQVNLLFKYGIQLGRAFQIKDDILGMFGKKTEIGKSILTDLKEAKKTLLIWYAYKHADKKRQKIIKAILIKNNVDKTDLLKIRGILLETGTLAYAHKEIALCFKKAGLLIAHSKIKPRYKALLNSYSQTILGL